jgi:hypothetical protein
MDIKDIVRTYFGSEQSLIEFFNKIQIDVRNRNRWNRLQRTKGLVESLKSEVREIIQTEDFLLEPSHVGKLQEVIEAIDKKLSFNPFSRKKGNKKMGRPQMDPEGYLVYVLSKTIIYRDGSYADDTNWNYFKMVIDHYKYQFPFLQNIGDKPRNLKDLRNAFYRRYGRGVGLPRWPAVTRKNKTERMLKKAISRKQLSKHSDSR